jgi:large subunit ribosomal protein L23
MTTRADTTLVQPIVTEKSVAVAGKYAFKVADKATKQGVKEAVETFYKGVTVVSVNMARLPDKTKNIARGKVARKRRSYKKAIVTLKAGETLEFNNFK